MALSYKNDADEDERLSPASRKLQDAEQQSGYDKDFDALTNPDHMAKDGKSGNLSNGIRQAEEDGGWQDNTSSEPTSVKGKGRGRKGPVIGLIGILTGGGIGAAIFSFQALLPIDVLQNLISKYDIQNTSMTIRTDKLIASKITNSATSGSCNVIQIACRFSRPSNKLLNQLEKNGITAVDKTGAKITGTGLFPNTRPASYKFTGSDGKEITVAAKDFSKTLASNAEFRAAFHSAYNPRFIGYADAIFKAIETRFGFNKQDSTANEKDAKSTQETINEEVAGEDEGVPAAEAAGGDALDTEAEGILTKDITSSAEEVAESGKGNAVGLLSGVVCTAVDIPGLVSKTVRAYQMAQLIKFAMVYLTAFSAIKAGDATQNEIATITSSLTIVSAGKSAMDSFGMKSALFGDTVPAKTDSYLKFSPGGNVVAALSGVTRYTDSTLKNQACSVAENPATGAGIDLATSETIVIPIVNAAAGFAISEALQYVLPPIISAGVQALAQSGVLKTVLQYFLGNLTQNLVGDDTGNALASGASNLMSQTANAGGNMPLTVNQAVAYNADTQEVNLAYAQEDRATLSPLDASNPNTALGSIVASFLPYYGTIHNASDILSTIGSIVPNSLSTLFGGSANAADTATQYEGCDDVSITDNNVAAGPFCNIDYGIPSQYLNEDPIDVLNNLGPANIDPDTGDPVPGSDLQTWLTNCTDGTTNQLSDCVISDETHAEYALYTVDHRIQSTMDGEDTTLDPSTTTASASADLSNSVSASTATEEKNVNNVVVAVNNSFTASLSSSLSSSISNEINNESHQDSLAPLSNPLVNVINSAVTQKRYGVQIS
jgi:hypothetical protein